LAAYISEKDRSIDRTEGSFPFLRFSFKADLKVHSSRPEVVPHEKTREMWSSAVHIMVDFSVIYSAGLSAPAATDVGNGQGIENS